MGVVGCRDQRGEPPRWAWADRALLGILTARLGRGGAARMRRSLARAAGLVAVFSFPVSPMGWRGRREEAVGARGESCRAALSSGSTHGSSPLPVKGRCGGLLRPRDGCASASPLVFSLLFASFGCSYKRGDQCGEPAPRWSLSHILDHIIKESG